MHKWRAIIFVFLSACGVASAQSTNTSSGILVEAAEELTLTTNGVWIATNGITVHYQGAVLTAERATVDPNSGEVIAYGKVRLQNGPQLLVAESIHYNFLSKKIIAQNFKSGQNPYFVRSDVMVGDQAAGVYVGANGSVTTGDEFHPGYS